MKQFKQFSLFIKLLGQGLLNYWDKAAKLIVFRCVEKLVPVKSLIKILEIIVDELKIRKLKFGIFRNVGWSFQEVTCNGEMLQHLNCLVWYQYALVARQGESEYFQRRMNCQWVTKCWCL